jgi:hypothetical protein
LRWVTAFSWICCRAAMAAIPAHFTERECA